MFMSQTISFRRAAAILFAVLIALPAGSLLFQSRGADATPPVRMTKADDHQRTMDLQHIRELRRGKAGRDKTDPNFANYDESKANPFPTLPDPLTLKNGKKVTTAADWWNKRRPEIVEDFAREVYGRVLLFVLFVLWEVASTVNGKLGDVDIITKQLVGVVDNSADPDIEVKIALSLTTPAHAAGPVPVIMQFGGFGGGQNAASGPPYGPNAFNAPPAGRGPVPAFGTTGAGRGPVGRGPAGSGPAGPTWQNQVLAKGWGYAALTPGSIQADNGAGLTLGIIGLCNKGQPRDRLFRDRQGR